MSSRVCAFVCVACSIIEGVCNGDSVATDAATKSFVQGTELLKKGDFQGALKSYASAAREDADNAQYRQEYMLLRRIIKIRAAVAKEDNAEKWWQLAVELRNYYARYELHQEVLALAKQIHEKRKTIESAILLADAHLVLNQDAEAEKVLTGVEKKDLTPQARAILGIALARQKKADEAKTVLSGIVIPEKPSPRLLLDVARLRILTGDVEGGKAALTTAFESTPPSALNSFKTYAVKTAELVPLAKGDQLASVLETKSKVKESECSGGKDCGTCPNRTPNCPEKKDGECAKHAQVKSVP